MSNAYPVNIEGRSIAVTADQPVTVSTQMDVRLPLGTTERGLLIRDVQENVQSVCGRTACRPFVVFENEDPATVRERNMISGGTVYCVVKLTVPFLLTRAVLVIESHETLFLIVLQ